jgi:GH25 family lysozyme M1 (1,4-beta-N-acetylmuramidase)
MSIASIDISNWTGFLTDQHIRCLKQHGIRYAVVRASLEPGMQRHEITRQQLDVLTAAGIETGVYLWCYGGWSPEQTVIDTVALLDGRPARWFWLDVEDEGDPVDAPWIAAAVGEIQRQGREPGIYTGAWYWQDRRYLNGETGFAHLPLWSAVYDSVPDLTVWKPYGGWQRLTGKQYAGSGMQALCGLSCDLNVFDERVLTPAPAPEPPKPGPKPKPKPETDGEPTLDQVKLGLVRKVIDEEWTALHRDAAKLAGTK